MENSPSACTKLDGNDPNMRLVIKRGERPDNRAETPEPAHIYPFCVSDGKNVDDKNTPQFPLDQIHHHGKTTDHRGAVGEKKKSSCRASFRGMPLTGVELDIPDGYVGALCHLEADPADASDSVNIVADCSDEAAVQRVILWHWDCMPTKDNSLVGALDWVRLSEAMMD